MENYLKYMYETHVLSSEKQVASEITDQLISLDSVDLSSLKKGILSSEFNSLSLLVAKYLVSFSPTNFTIKLSTANLLVYQRIQKMLKFSELCLSHQAAAFIKQFFLSAMENGMGFPIRYDRNKLSSLFQDSELSHVDAEVTVNHKKGAKSQKTDERSTKYSYSKLIYEYKRNSEANRQEDEKPPVPKTKPIAKKEKTKQKFKPSEEEEDLFMLNIEELTRLLRLSKFSQSLAEQTSEREIQASLELMGKFYSTPNLESVIRRKRYQKIEEHLHETMGSDCLLVFNLLKKYPFVTEKQLLRLSLMGVVETRKAISSLVEAGYAYFYYENSRTIVYKVSDWEVIEKRHLDVVCQTLMNLLLYSDHLSLNSLTGNHSKSRKKILEIECEVSRLDDVLLVVGVEPEGQTVKVTEWRL